MLKSEQPPDAVPLVTDRRLRLFGYIARSSSQEDHHRAVAVVIRGLPPEWKRPLGRPSHTSPGFVQWRQTLANRTLALHLPGGRQLFVTTAAHCGHSNAPVEYAMKEEEEEERVKHKPVLRVWLGHNLIVTQS